MLIDKFGRQITYLRLGVTDRCNLRCFYCMPQEGIEFTPRNELLSYEELIRISELLSKEGITKIRLTGGEPFVRKDLMGFIQELNKIQSKPELHITSNGVLIEPHLRELKRLGIKSINLSLDTLDSNRFAQITNRDYFDKVIASFHTMLKMEIPTKVNMVVMKGRNEEDIIPMARLAMDKPVQIRFIEEMPFNGSGETHEILSYKEIENILSNEFRDLKRTNDEYGSTSINYSSLHLKGELGIIPAYSRTFCGSCNRIRITSQGLLINCLYDEKGLDLKNLIRNGISDSDLLNEIQKWILTKSKDGFEAENNRNNSRFESMSIIGG